MNFTIKLETTKRDYKTSAVNHFLLSIDILLSVEQTVLGLITLVYFPFFQAERLHMSGFIQEGDMVRLNAIQRAQSIPESITPYCADTDQLDMAARYRVIISTCSTAGQLYSLGLRAGHITHVFVDEVCNFSSL